MQPFGPMHSLPGNLVPYSNQGPFALNPGIINPQLRMSSHLALAPNSQAWAGSPLLTQPPAIAHTNLATANVPPTSQNNAPALNLDLPQANSTRNDGNGQGDQHPGHGRPRGRMAARHRDRRNYDSYSDLAQREPSTDDSDEEYQANQEHREVKNVKSLHIDKFSNENKDMDFVVWVNQFEEAVMRAHNPHSRRRHMKYCLRWFPNCLQPCAYSIWHRATNRKSDWEALKSELTEAYEDPTIREEWSSNFKAYMWDEANVSLQTYCAKVQRYVDTFDTHLADCPPAKKQNYYSRFIAGLPDDYNDYVRLSMPPKSADVVKARDLCIKFQNIKKSRGAKTGIVKTEVGASVQFSDPTVISRITENSTNINRLMGKVDKLFQKQTASNPSSSQQQTTNSYSTRNAGSTPFYSKPRDNSQSRSQERVNRFLARRQQRGGRSGKFGRNDRFNKQEHKQKPEGQEEGLALETDVESCAEAEDSVALYDQYKEDKEMSEYLAFCAAKDAAEQEEN